ncbi:MAG TPA: hypothetical protein VJ944_00700 [Thermoplasmataceae archaeon]|nr:hypothetical protein [Thermoplasmataceae archaeon]
MDTVYHFYVRVTKYIIGTKLPEQYEIHLKLARMVSLVVAAINAMAFYKGFVGTPLYAFDSAYVAANSAHFIVVSLTAKGFKVKTEKENQSS